MDDYLEERGAKRISKAYINKLIRDAYGITYSIPPHWMKKEKVKSQVKKSRNKKG